jgi:hypothetical protein
MAILSRMQFKAAKTKKKAAREAVTLSPDELLTPQQLARRWRVTRLTLKRYRDAGRLRAIVFSPRSIRFALAEVLRVEKEASEKQPLQSPA